MSDPYPENLAIEIDRPRLQTYLRTKWLLGWVLSLGIFSAFIIFAAICDAIEHHPQSWQSAAIHLAKFTTIGLGSTTLLGLALYLLLSHRRAARFAASLEVSVEGPFLRIRQHTTLLTDRKLHFRAIIDYSTTQDFLMRRMGLYGLHLTTAASGLASMIDIPCVKDCLRVRDMLADIDRLRENQCPPARHALRNIRKFLHSVILSGAEAAIGATMSKHSSCGPEFAFAL